MRNELKKSRIAHMLSALIFSLMILAFIIYNTLFFSGFLESSNYSKLAATLDYIWWPYIPQFLLALTVFILGVMSRKVAYFIGLVLVIWTAPMSLLTIFTSTLPTLSLGNVLLINDIMALVGIIFAILNIWCLLKIISTKGSSTHES